MKTLILSAGFGTRLKPLFPNLSKSLLPLGNRNVIEAQIEKILPTNACPIFVLTNNVFYNSLNQWHISSPYRDNIHIIANGVSNEREKKGAIGDFDFFIKKIKLEDDLLILGNDNLFNASFEGIINFFTQQRDAAVIALHHIKNTNLSRQGDDVVFDDKTKRIISFRQIPEQSGERPQSPYIASLLYLLPNSMLHLTDTYLRDGQNPDNAGAFIVWLIDRGYPVFGYEMPGKRFDVGDIRAYQSTLDNFS